MDGYVDIGARKKARWLKRVKYCSAEICLAKEEGIGGYERIFREVPIADGWIIE